jgi:hypothetical protein
MVMFLPKNYLDRNITFFRCLPHNLSPISLLRNTMVCETLFSGGLMISPHCAHFEHFFCFILYSQTSIPYYPIPLPYITYFFLNSALYPILDIRYSYLYAVFRTRIDFMRIRIYRLYSECGSGSSSNFVNECRSLQIRIQVKHLTLILTA